jgi:hypothetical protein
MTYICDHASGYEIQTLGPSLDLLLDLVLWFMREKDDHPNTSSPTQQQQTRRKPTGLVADGLPFTAYQPLTVVQNYAVSLPQTRR